MGNSYISIMGLLYSGSSAVFDYVRQFEGFGYMSNDESRIFINGITILYELKKNNQKPTEEQKRKIISRFSGDFDNSLYWYNGNVAKNRSMFMGIDTDKSGKLIREFLEKIEDVDIKKFILLARKFIDEFCSLKLSEDTRILNNDPDACLISSTLLFDRNKAVVVYRNLCDQFIDQINHKSSYYLKGKDKTENVVANMENAKIFVDNMNWRIQLFVRDIEFIEKYDSKRLKNICIVSFEDFIRDEEVRNGVCSFLELSERSWYSHPVFETFFPEQSVLNIGISKGIKQEIRDYITSNVEIHKIISRNKVTL